MEEISDNYTLRGKICFQSAEKIPSNTSYEIATSGQSNFNLGGNIAFRTHNSFSDPPVNKDFYRDRAEFLETWGGSEILNLFIQNKSGYVTKNVRVELSSYV